MTTALTNFASSNLDALFCIQSIMACCCVMVLDEAVGLFDGNLSKSTMFVKGVKQVALGHLF